MTSPTATAPVIRTKRVLPPLVTGQEWILIGLLALLWVILAVATPGFLSPNSIQPLLGRLAPIGIMAIGMTVIIVTGGIDISVSAIVMVSAVSVAKTIVGYEVPLVGALALAMGMGFALGMINGLLIAYGRVAAIIITFGTANLFQFIALRIFNSSTVNGIPPTLRPLGNGVDGRTFGIPHSFMIMVVLVAIAWWYLRHSPTGRHYFAIGDDENAAVLAGVNVKRRIWIAYGATGLLAGLAACIVVASGTNTLDQSVGRGMELQVIAACVIGGTSVMGGRGSVFGSVLGALLVQTVSAGVTQLGWPSQLINFFVGVIIILAVGIDLVREHRRRAAL